MTELMGLIGAVAGTVVGCAHAIGIYRRCDRAPTRGRLSGRARAAYYAAWTLALWVLFGAYVLIVWLFGMALYLAAGRPPPPAADTSAGDRS